MGSDWVVLTTRSKLTDPVGRIRVGMVSQSVLEELIEDQNQVAVMLARSSADQRNCRILGLLDLSVFYHSCGGWAGLSGSPIIIGLDGAPVVIGITIAKIMRPPDTRGPLFLGVARAIDDTITTAIAQAADYARGHRTRSSRAEPP